MNEKRRRQIQNYNNLPTVINKGSKFRSSKNLNSRGRNQIHLMPLESYTSCLVKTLDKVEENCHHFANLQVDCYCPLYIELEQ